MGTWGVVTKMAPSTLLCFLRFSSTAKCSSDVPGGVSTSSTSSSPHATSDTNWPIKAGEQGNHKKKRFRVKIRWNMTMLWFSNKQYWPCTTPKKCWARMTALHRRTCFLRPPPHHCFIRVFQQEADRHEGEAFLGVGIDRHPPGVTLVHIRPADTQHPGDAGPTKVNVQDANLVDISVTCSHVFAYTFNQTADSFVA